MLFVIFQDYLQPTLPCTPLLHLLTTLIIKCCPWGKSITFFDYFKNFKFNFDKYTQNIALVLLFKNDTRAIFFRFNGFITPRLHSLPTRQSNKDNDYTRIHRKPYHIQDTSAFFSPPSVFQNNTMINFRFYCYSRI